MSRSTPYLSHMDFHIGSGLAALTEVGNEAEDLHFYGGRYGILTDKTSPAWQFTLIDSVFDGQREAAVREHEVGLTLIRDTFRNVPVAIDIDPHYSDELWVKDCRFEQVSKAAVIISNESSPLTEIGFENAVLNNVPTFARFSRKRQISSGKRCDLQGCEFQLRPHRARRRNDRSHRHDLRCRCAERIARSASARNPRAAADFRLGQRPHARRRGR